MGTLFSGIGLVSGFDIAGTVDRLIQLEGRPRDQILSRIRNLDAQKAAYLDISARVSQMVSRLASLKTRAAFTSTKVHASNDQVLAVSAGAGVPPGSYSFQVRQLASTHQMISRGFASRDSLLGVGTVTIEPPAARINQDLRLDQLNGHLGVQRGRFRLGDAAGGQATIDITDALTAGEVVERINAAGLNIRAAVSGDGFTLTETSGGAITVAEEGGRTAQDLGLLTGTQSGGVLRGAALMALAERTPLKTLNDGAGVDRSRSGGDFVITGPDGDLSIDLSGILKPGTRLAQLNGGQGVQLGTIRVRTFTENGSPIEREINLSSAQTIGDVQNILSQQVSGLSITITSDKLNLAYDNGDKDLANRIEIEDIGSGRTAADLGIVGQTTNGRITGGTILTMGNLGDVVAAINHAAGNNHITASLDGTRIVLTSSSGAFSVSEGSSRAAADLGLVGESDGDSLRGERILGGLNTTLLRSLNGGRGFELGTIEVTAGGASTAIDLSGMETLQDVLDALNAAGGDSFSATYDSTGTRISLRSADGVTPITVSDLSGDFAAVSGLNGDGSAVLRSANLQKRYVSEATLLKDLHNGAGVTLGTVKITNSAGVFQRIDLASARTIGDVVRTINTRSQQAGLGVTARINDQGDGIVLEDASEGSARMKVEDESGSAARGLGLLGEAEDGVIDGSFEIKFELGSSDSLNKLQNMINSQSRIATATILNDGSGTNPYRLQISSRISGRDGELIIDSSGLDLDLTTLSRAQDAKVIMGSDSERGILLTSANNTISGAIQGLTLELLGTSEQPVQVTASQSRDAAVTDFSGLIDAFNDALSRISDYTRFDPETEQAGVLLGDGNLQTIEARLRRFFTGRVPSSVGGIARLSELGVSVRNGRLELDQAKLRDQLEENPEGVIAFFTDPEHGFGVYLSKELEAMTQKDGLLKNRENSLQKQRDLLNDRVTSMNAALERKRDRLTRQFLSMEQALSQLQSQQAALGQLASLAAAAGAAR